MLELDRLRGALVGLALGDAMAEELKGVPEPETAPLLCEGLLPYSDRTQHAALAARALSATLPRYRSEDGLADAMAAELVAWLDDPTTRQRHPGHSSMEAASRLRHGISWRRTGNPESDGVDGVLRAVPAGLALPPDQAMVAARAMASITHASPTALEAASAVAWLVSHLTRGAALTPELVEACAAEVRRESMDGSIADGLVLAARLGAALAEDPPTHLDPNAMPPGDGGKRSRSAVGLAVVAALIYAPAVKADASTTRALNLAARIDADSRAVAALTGALLGAANGLGAFSRTLTLHVEGRRGFVTLADRLFEAATGATAVQIVLNAPVAVFSGHDAEQATERAEYDVDAWARVDDVHNREQTSDPTDDHEPMPSPETPLVTGLDEGDEAPAWLAVDDEEDDGEPFTGHLARLDFGADAFDGPPDASAGAFHPRSATLAELLAHGAN